MTGNDDGGQDTTPAAVTKSIATTKQDHGKGSAPRRLPTVNAIAVPPLGRRTLWMHWVASCCYCGYGHAHRSPGITAGVRESGCHRGTYYVRVQRAQGRAVAA